MKQHLYSRKKKGKLISDNPHIHNITNLVCLTHNQNKNLQYIIEIKVVQKCDTVYKYTVHSM